MKVYYTAKSYKGETKGGELNVKDERDLANQLRSEGFMLTSFKELEKDYGSKIKVDFFDRFYSIPLSEKMMFARNLAVMISSGLPLNRAIINIKTQSKNKRFIKVMASIQENIQTGGTLADGLAKYPGIFNELFVNMIRVGEASGNLEEVLNILASQLEKDHELMSKIKGSMVYPAVILVAMIGIGILMMIYVVPQITQVFKDLNATLPPTTQFIINLSTLLQKHSIATLIGMIVIVMAIRLAATTSLGKKVFGLVVIKIPVISNIVIKLNCARFCRVYSSLLKSGISSVESLKILSKTLTNYYYKKALEKATTNIQKGINLSEIIYQEKSIFPILVPQMIAVGEETGKTEAVLLKLAEFYESEVANLTKNLSSIIEPVLMLIIGGAVGFFAVSILQPMYSVLENIK